MLALVAAALTSLLDLLIELVMNPVDLILPVVVGFGVAVPLNMVNPVADCRGTDAVIGSWAVAVGLMSVSCPSLAVDTLSEKGDSVRSLISASTSFASLSTACIT